MVSSQHPASKQTKTDQPPRSWRQQQAHEQEERGTAPEAPGMMINEDCPLPSPVEAGPFLVSGFTEFELKGSMRYHLSAVSAWSGVSSKQQSSFLTRNPNKSRWASCVCGWGAHGSPAHQHPFFPPPRRPRLGPVVVHFTISRGAVAHVGPRAEQGPHCHPGSLLHRGLAGEVGLGTAGSRAPVSPLGVSPLVSETRRARGLQLARGRLSACFRA